ncbi:hypothetical protein HBA54_27230 [Pelagibius litoralis]|uniref:Uncharacterized protein n=1 Tax=Pelagibius litoralis TaxID=374515 RepID=A0A967F395_9PROT|nr:hypothetical protein [Pelagibius litoralis]NIA72290.1 hypothetical protein [Pelagibius litoralis]
MSGDDKVIRPDFKGASSKVVPPELAPKVDPKAGYDPLTAIRVMEILELQTRLILAQAELQCVTARLREIAQEALDGDAG